MIALIQRVTFASVVVDGEMIGSIDSGILALWGVEKGDDQSSMRRLMDRVISYRVFADDEGKMNRSLLDTSGGLLLVPQFTLAADTRKGKRPSFSSAASPADGEKLFDAAVAYARANLRQVETGSFGADMQVSLINDGPVTFWLQVKPGG